MTSTDQRRVRVAAPPEGGRSTPPPRRPPHVVTPTATPPRAEPSLPAAPRSVVVPAPTSSETPMPRPSAPPAGRRPSPANRRPSPARPPTPPPSPGWRRVVPSRRAVLGTLVVLLLLGVGTLAWAHAKFASIERIDLSSVLASGDGTNYLIVGSDTREGVDPNDPNAGAILGDDSVGGPQRSDTILILRIDSQGARTLSVPRDLFVTISETGKHSRINSAFNGGPSRLIATLRDQLQLPVHHYLEVNFVSFASMVDSLGGITIDFPHPAFDTHSGLSVTEAGPQTLSGTQALAFVRSRYYTEVIDGKNSPEGTGDLGRVQRQQQFLSAVMDKIGATKNPITLARVADTLAGGMRIDSDLGFWDALNLLRRMRGLDPAPNSLPTVPFTTSAGAQVLRLDQPGSDAVLAGFGSPGAAVT